jgi:hypothetical protein
MNRRIELLKNITAEILNYLVVCSCAYIILVDFAKVQPGVWQLTVLLIIPLFFYGLREWCDRLWLFLVLHGLPLCGILFLYHGKAIYKVIYIAIVLFYTGLSISKRIHSTGRGMEAAAPPAVAGIYLALYLLDTVQGGGENGALLLQLLICFAAGYFIFYYLRQFLSYVDINARTTENIPVKNVFYSSAGLAVGFTVIAFWLITICANRSLIEKISAAIRAFIRKLFSLIRITPGEVNILPEITDKQGGGAFPDLGEAVEPSLFMQIMDVVLTLAAFGLILFFLVSGIVALKRILQDGFARKAYRPSFEETAYTDQVESISRREGGRRAKRGSLAERWKKAASPEERIRRIYKRTIRKNIPVWEGERVEGLLDMATARECCFQVFADDISSAEEFVRLYEKARYGRMLCRQEDVSRMKELSEKLHGYR